MTNTIPSEDELPVTATFDLTGVRDYDFPFTGDTRRARVRVVAYRTAVSRRRYALIVFRDQEFIAAMDDLSFE